MPLHLLDTEGMKPEGEKTPEPDNGPMHFVGGVVLFGLGIYLLLDSVRVTSGGNGWVSGAIGRGGHMLETTSMGIVFVPFVLGVISLFYDAQKKIGWWLSGLGLAVLLVEIFSRIRFILDMKTTHLLMILMLIAAGAAFMLKGMVSGRKSK